MPTRLPYNLVAATLRGLKHLWELEALADRGRSLCCQPAHKSGLFPQAHQFKRQDLDAGRIHPDPRERQRSGSEPRYSHRTGSSFDSIERQWSLYLGVSIETALPNHSGFSGRNISTTCSPVSALGRSSACPCEACIAWSARWRGIWQNLPPERHLVSAVPTAAASPICSVSTAIPCRIGVS